MKQIDILLEQLYKSAADRPQRKFEETITTFNRDIFYYDRDGVNRQLRYDGPAATYEDHRLAVETAVNMQRAGSQHEIALAILSHRHFAEYRAKTFAGLGCFRDDYSFLLLKIGNLFVADTSTIVTSTIANQLGRFTEPTLVQLNHLAGVAEPVILPNDKFSLEHWLRVFSSGAPESITYRVVGEK